MSVNGNWMLANNNPHSDTIWKGMSRYIYAW